MANYQPLPFERPIQILEDQLAKLKAKEPQTPELQEQIRQAELEITRETKKIFENLDAWETVQVARQTGRPQTPDYIELVFDEFVELHGDRAFGDDRAILTGFAKLNGRKIMLVGQQKGRTIQERSECLYGCAHPEGYRKALSRMQMAAKYKLPIVCLIDTPGAYPGIGAEERGQAYNIALNLREMSQLATPITAVVIGEGGSGGALGIGIADHVAVLEHAYYSVISPEGCAGILWKHVKHANKAAHALKFTAPDLLRLKVIDEIIREPLGGAHRNHREMAMELKASLTKSIDALVDLPTDVLLQRRYEKFRNMGEFEEAVTTANSESIEAPKEPAEA